MKKQVLFLCQGNSCQSQMAEGLLKHFYGENYEVYSAGMTPKNIDKNAVDVMHEIGIDISKHVSKPIEKFMDKKFDIVITFFDEENIPKTDFLSNLEKINWGNINPAEKIDTQKDLLKALREVRDNLKKEIIDYFNPNKGG